MFHRGLRLIAFALVVAIAIAYAIDASAPRTYVATGGVLLPGGMVKVRETDSDPRAAATRVQAFIRKHRDALLVDPPLVAPQEEKPVLGFALAGALAFAGAAFWRRRRPRLRSEGEFTTALGETLLGARPLVAPQICRQLGTHWFGRGRRLLAVVSAERGEGRTRVTADLARGFAAMGESTLVIDADLRSPSLHRAFGLPNERGLADFLEGRGISLAQRADNLCVLVAGRPSEDPLELLSRERLQQFLVAATRRYRVVLIDTPAAASGPDLQLFAALGGGALVVARRPGDAGALARLHDLLERCKARVVGTVFDA